MAATNITSPALCPGMPDGTIPLVPVFDWDPHMYFLCFLVTAGIQLSCFAVAYGCQFDTITDFAGSMNFVLLAIFTLCMGGQYHPRQIISSALMVLSRVELALFLFYRVLKRGRDARFDEVRIKFWPFLGFWIFQIVWVYGVSVSTIFLNTACNTAPIGPLDIVGIVLFAIGFLSQFVSDVQKYRFRSNPANKGKVCDVGLWGITRHPNYFGEMLLWWGLFMLAVPAFDGTATGWVAIISPVLTMLILLFVSGMPTAEGDNQARFYRTVEGGAAYDRYRKRTPAIIPFVPAIYEVMPLVLKRILCFEFPQYEYRPNGSDVVGGDSPGDLERNLAGGEEEGKPTVGT